MGRERGELINRLMLTVGGRFSTSLGIDLESGDPEEVFKWFLASILFGARIGERIAENAYREFERAGVLTPQRVLETGWDGLVELLDVGGYVRYDFKTASQLLEIMERLKGRYRGDLNALHKEAADPQDLEARLLEFKGVGPVTVNIFLRELRGIWEKAQPLPSDLAILAARNLGLIASPGQTREEKVRALSHLEEALPEGLPDLESALVRLGKGWCRKERHDDCPLAQECAYRMSTCDR